MATFDELFGVFPNTDLQNKVEVAAIIKAQALLAGTPSANDSAWANNALKEPRQMSVKLLKYMIAANSGAAVGAITGATDAVIQTNVNDAADKLIAAGITGV